MRVHTICQRHNTTALVGPGSLLSELECVACIAEYDEASRWTPCCSAWNTTCCGHDDDHTFFVEILSPNYCNAVRYDDVPF